MRTEFEGEEWKVTYKVLSVMLGDKRVVRAYFVHRRSCESIVLRQKDQHVGSHHRVEPRGILTCEHERNIWGLNVDKINEGISRIVLTRKALIQTFELNLESKKECHLHHCVRWPRMARWILPQRPWRPTPSTRCHRSWLTAMRPLLRRYLWILQLAMRAFLTPILNFAAGILKWNKKDINLE